MSFVVQTVNLHEGSAFNVRYLFNSVTKQTVKSTTDALLRLITPQSGAATPSQVATTTPSAQFAFHRYLLATCTASLLNDRTLSDDKIAVLRSLFVKTLEMDNGISLVADVMESATTVFQSADKLVELFEGKLTLSQGQLITLLTGLCYCTVEGWRDAALSALTRTLQNVSDAGALKATLQTAVGEGPAAVLIPHVLSLISPISSLQPLADALVSMGLTGLPSASHATFSQYEESISVAKVIEEVGSGCLHSVEELKELLQMFPTPLSESVVAELLCLLACPSTFTAESASTNDGSYNSLRASAGLGEATKPAAGAAPQTAVVVQAVREVQNLASKENESANREFWTRVLQRLDHPNVRVERFAAIAAAYKRATGDLLPVGPFVGRSWRNSSVQAAALKYMIDNPDLVARDNLTGKRSRELSKTDFQTTDDVSSLWRLEVFMDAVVTVTARERGELEAALTAVITKAPSLALLMLLTSTNPTVRHYHLASTLLKQSISGGKTLDTIITAQSLTQLTKESKLPSLVGLLCDVVSGDVTKTLEVAEFMLRSSLADALIKCGSSTRLIVQAAIVAKEVAAARPAASANNARGAPANPFDRWLETTLADSSRTKVSSLKPSVVAAAVLEAADDLIVRSKYVHCATQALQVVINAPTTVQCTPGLLAHAKLLLQQCEQATGNGTAAAAAANSATPSAFSVDVENEATEFFKKLYADDSLQPMPILDRLFKSANPRDRQVFSCIVHILFEETRSLTDYPLRQLQTAARLFGQLVASDLLGTARLQKALTLLLPTVMKQTDMKTFEYGIIAVEQFKSRLVEWPAVGKQLKSVVDLDMRIPGIMGMIDEGLRKAAAEEKRAAAGAQGAETAAAPAPAAAAMTTNSLSAGLHQLDIRILLGNDARGSAIVQPPSVVQDQINFLVGNTDPNNLESNARELASLLKPEYYAFFAEYLVVKRVSLEPNYHRMYLTLVEKINLKELERRLREATVQAVRRLLNSDRIRTDTSDRSLLKNLGSWYGCITLAKNVPVLARDLDLKELLFMGLREGKLIAVVPFVAKVLDQCSQGKFFRPPNPWTMAQLGHLLELYRLPDLKLTLRFEVEVLCKNIGIALHDVENFLRSISGGAGVSVLTVRNANGGYQRVTMGEIRSSLDIHGSTDFRLEEPRQSESPPPNAAMSSPASGGPPGTHPQRRGLQADAPPYQPRGTPAPVVEIAPPPRPPITIAPETVRTGDELRYIPPARVPVYLQALVKTLEPVVREVQPHLERAALIAAHATKNLVSKDFARDPDPNLMRRAGQAMSRSLASNHCTVMIKEPLWTALRKHANVLASHLHDNAQTRTDIAETVSNNNFDLCLRYLEYQASEMAARKADELLAPLAEEKAMRKGELPLSDPSPPTIHIPDQLRPTGPLPSTLRAVYDEFFNCIPIIEQLANLLRSIEDAAQRHYQAPNAETLSLTNPQFTEKQLSEQHTVIRTRLVEVAQLVTVETAVPLISWVFQRLVDLTDNLSRIDNSPANRPAALMMRLLNEVYLFVIQSTNEKGRDRAMQELTRAYLAHERKWRHCDILVNFMRLRVIDVAKFDEALSRALQETVTNRSIVEFAGSVIQKVLIEDKLATAKDLEHTLLTLEQIARVRNPQKSAPTAAQQPPPQNLTPNTTPAPFAQAPQGAMQPQAARPGAVPMQGAPAVAAPVVPSVYPPHVLNIRLKSQYPPERREETEALFAEWIEICAKKQQISADPNANATTEENPQMLQMQFVRRVQAMGMLASEKGQIDSFLGMFVEVSVEHYATVALQLERANPNYVSQQQRKPEYRFPFSPQLFTKADAFCDLAALLIRCCSWGENIPEAKAEVALVQRMLQVIQRVMNFNHEAIQTQQYDGPVLRSNSDMYQRVFMQQPYVRIFSNLLIQIHRTHPEPVVPPVAPGAPPPPAPPQDAMEDLLRCFTETFRLTNPTRCPGFAFGWLECIAHRHLVVRVLRHRKLWPHYVQLLCDALKFIDYFSKGINGVPANALLFAKSVLKLMLILLHDFADFVLTNHLQLCDHMPLCCVQLRNVVLCAFPQNIRLPDPFTQNLQIDRLPEMSVAPPTVDTYRKSLFQNSSVSMEDITSYVHSSVQRLPPNFPARVLEAIKSTQGARFNVPLLNGIVLHAAVVHLAVLQQQVSPQSVADSPPAELFRCLCTSLDSEGRYHLLNSFVNHLRFPNSHTHYFSQLMLHLFLPSSQQHVTQLQNHQEAIQEQITRVLVERLIISRPHPWGLLVTFIEMIKNKRYSFWDRQFIRCSPEIEKMFDSLSKSVSGNSTNQQQQQQQPPQQAQQQQAQQPKE